jgi:pimeloyl-ACP methyl ester carboxylesterase
MLETRPSPAGAPEVALVPPRPSAFEERLAGTLLLGLGPRMVRRAPLDPPAALAPYETLDIARAGRSDHLGAHYFPCTGVARAAVLCVPPWVEWGQGYFHRRGRIEALRDAGCHVMTVDLSGFGRSARTWGFLDRDVADALAALRRRHPTLPSFVWGVSAGGYWSHPVLARDPGVVGAMFEDVSPHLLEWSQHTTPRSRPLLHVFRLALPRAARFLDLRLHAPRLRGRATAYVSGALDVGVPASDTQTMAALAGAEVLVVKDAGHLGAIKREPQCVIEMGLCTLERALLR